MKLPSKLENAWKWVAGIMSNPWAVIDAARKSPLALVLAVVFIVQPVIDTITGVVGDIAFVKQKLDPGQRPATVKELDLLNRKIDAVARGEDSKDVDDSYVLLKKRLDENYQKEHPKK